MWIGDTLLGPARALKFTGAGVTGSQDGSLTQIELPAGGAHPDLAAHDLLGLATQMEVDGKAALVHGHIVADTTGLQTALDAKEPLGAVATHALLEDAHHLNDNDPSATEKLALGGTSGVPSGTNRYVTDADARNANARTPTAHAASHQGGADALAVDAVAGTGSLRTLGAGAQQAAAGDHAHAGGGAPADADYLVGTAHAGLSGEIVVGATPGGELGGTWAAPTVDATHSGSAHHAQDHATRHVSGGADAVKLDDLAAPDDVTDLNASTAAHGLMQKYPGGTTNFLRADGAFAAPPGGGALSYQEADRATDLALTTSFADATSLSLAAGTWLIIGQTSVESTSTTQGNISIRLRNTTDGVTLSLAEGEVDSALPDRMNFFVHAVVALAATKTIALQGLQSAGTSHMIGPGNLGSDTAAKVTRLTAVKIA